MNTTKPLGTEEEQVTNSALRHLRDNPPPPISLFRTRKLGRPLGPVKLPVRRWGYRYTPEEGAEIDRLRALAGLDNDAEFLRRMLEHWSKTHPSTKPKRVRPPKRKGKVK